MKRFLILLITIPNFLFAETNEENILFKRMYENQEIMKKQMQDIIEENERLLKKIEKLESQQEIFYKETNEKISVIEKKTITNLNESKKLEAQVINQQENQDQKKNQAVDLIKKTDIEELVDQEELDNYVNKAIDEIVEDGELMWRPDISDYIDPKDD